MTARSTRRLTLATLAVLPALAAGCQKCPPLEPMTVDAVVERVNGNNELLPWVKASIRNVKVTVPDNLGLDWTVPTDLFGYMVYAQPNHYLLRLDKGGLMTVMELGANPHIFWMWVSAGADRGWVGTHADWPPGVDPPLLIHPSQVMRLLGVDMVGPDLTEPPLATVRPDDCRGVYVLSLVEVQGASARLLREIDVDPDTFRPTGVRLFDKFGRATVESELSEWAPIAGSAGWFPRRVLIRWLARPADADAETGMRPGSSLTLSIGEVEAKEKYGNEMIYEPRPPANIRLEPLRRGPTVRQLAQQGAS